MPTKTKSQPQIPGIITPVTGAAKPKITTRTYIPFTRLNITAKDFFSLVDVARIIQLFQAAVEDCTLATRSDPQLNKVIVQKVQLTSGQPAAIYHGLGSAFTGYWVSRVYSGSSAPSFVEVTNNGGQDPTQHLVLAAGATGTYDFTVTA